MRHYRGGDQAIGMGDRAYFLSGSVGSREALSVMRLTEYVDRSLAGSGQ